MKRLLFLLLLAVAFSQCSPQDQPLTKEVKTTLVDDNGKIFPAVINVSVDNQQYLPKNLRSQTAKDPCVFPTCGYEGGVRYCCPGTGSCWAC